jgi:kynurenine formamidase
MCDCGHQRGYGWKGWTNIPSPEDSLQKNGSQHPWIELSHPVSETMPKLKAFPKPRFELIRSIPDHPLNVTEMSFVVHCGTHVDSPRHFFLDGPAFEEIPFEKLWGPGLIYPVKLGEKKCIEIEHLEDAKPLINRGDILILNTGFHKEVSTEAYEEDHPYLSESAAEWIVDQGVKFLAIDTPTPDLPVAKRSAGFDFPIHRILLAKGVLIAEHLTNLEPLSGYRAEIMFNALNISGSDGAPARVIARKIS